MVTVQLKAFSYGLIQSKLRGYRIWDYSYYINNADNIVLGEKINC